MIWTSIRIVIPSIQDYYQSPTKKFRYESKINANFIIECDKIRPVNAFTHGKMRHCLLKVLDSDYEKDLTEILYDVECYHIECEYLIKKLVIYFEFTLFTLTENHASIAEKFRLDIIDMLENNGSKKSQEFIQVKNSSMAKGFPIIYAFYGFVLF